jgi:hypothetical protein
MHVPGPASLVCTRNSAVYIAKNSIIKTEAAEQVAVRYKARTGSNTTQGMNVCLRLFCACFVCVCSSLALG